MIVNKSVHDALLHVYFEKVEENAEFQYLLF